MQEIRRGILLAKHDYQLIMFETKHRHVEPVEEPIVKDMLEIYTETEDLILGHAEITELTVEAYYRTIVKLRGDDPLPK